jgi:hypothetical protein
MIKLQSADLLTDGILSALPINSEKAASIKQTEHHFIAPEILLTRLSQRTHYPQYLTLY